MNNHSKNNDLNPEYRQDNDLPIEEVVRRQLECLDIECQIRIADDDDNLDSLANEFPELRRWLLEDRLHRQQAVAVLDTDLHLRAAIVGGWDKPSTQTAAAGYSAGGVDAKGVDASGTDSIGFHASGDFESDLKQRLLAAVQAAPNQVSESDFATDEPGEFELQAYAELFEEDNLPPGSSKSLVESTDAQEAGRIYVAPSKSNRLSRRWFWPAAAIIATAASYGLFVLFQPPVDASPSLITAEMLGNESLDWNPVRDGNWNGTVQAAPVDRPFPSHLIKFRAQSWKRIAVAEDEEAVVYDLIPPNDLSSMRAYVYVLRGRRNYELPRQFDSVPDANRQYRFWSVVCQEELVYVLVFEGEQNRLHELVERPEVG